MLNEKYQILLDQYDIHADHFRRNRGGILCYSDHGIFSLARTSLSEERLTAVSQWTQKLKDAGFPYVDQYILNKNNCFLSYDKYYEPYALRKTFSGSECDIHSLKDIKTAASSLASLHYISTDLTFSSDYLHKYTSICRHYHQKYTEIKSIFRYIKKKKNKGTFEYLFLNEINDILKQMEYAITLLGSSPPSHTGWCHGTFQHHNVILSGNHTAIIHFEHFFYGYPLLDLYYFLQKVLEKNDYQFRFCETILQGYQIKYPLSRQDLTCLYGLLLFPEKFWKISNQYMAHKKHFVSPRYIDKLNQFIVSREIRTILLEKYLQTYNVF